MSDRIDDSESSSDYEAPELESVESQNQIRGVSNIRLDSEEGLSIWLGHGESEDSSGSPIVFSVDRSEESPPRIDLTELGLDREHRPDQCPICFERRGLQIVARCEH